MRRPWIIVPLVVFLPLSLFAAQQRKPPQPSFEQRPPPEPFAPTWNEPDGFRGLTFGEDLRQNITECPFSRFSNGLKDYRWSDTKERCWESMSGSKGNEIYYELHNFSPLGRVPASHLQAIQVDNRLTFASMTVNHDSFGDLLAILMERYGRPTHEYMTEVQTTMGAKFTSRNLRWVGKKIKIELNERSGRVDQTLFGIFLLDWEAQNERERDQQRRQGAEGLSR
jgi:hypothetical protein